MLSKCLWQQRLADLQNRRAILSLLERNEVAKVLDLGCSSGEFTLEIGRKIGTHLLYGIDIDEKCLHLAEKRGIRSLYADLNEAFPISDRFFDVVCANQVIEHVLKTDIFMREVYRVLRPTGYVIISTPNIASLHNIFFLILGVQPLTMPVSEEVYVGNWLNPRNKTLRGTRVLGHVRFFTPDALYGLTQYYGFMVEKIVGVGYYPFPGKVADFLSRIDPNHSVFLTLKARKTSEIPALKQKAS